MTGFKKAERTKVPLKIALTGPSGSGKTYSALLMASGMGKKIAFIDTENGSASLYDELVDFDVLEIGPPFTIAKYQEAINAAVEAGYDVLVIDSITHAWAGEGGLMDQKNQIDARGGNSYVNWGKITPQQEKFKSSMLQAQIHLIVTMRSKQDYVLEQNDRGKAVPQKVGMAPIQREGMEYEFTTVLDIAMNHEAAVSKDRTGLFDGQMFKITKKTGQKLVKWLSGAADEDPSVIVAREQEKAVKFELKRIGLGKAALKAFLLAEYKTEDPKELDAAQRTELLGKLQDMNEDGSE